MARPRPLVWTCLLLAACEVELPVLLPPAPIVVTSGRFLSLGYRHSCDVRGGQLRCWGDGLTGQLGHGDSQGRRVPSLVGADTDWVSVSTGEEHTCALKRDGSIWCTGGNGRGQLGLGDLAARASFTKVSLPAQALSLTATANFTCVTLADASARCWGDNLEGQAGLEDARPGADQLTPQRVKGEQRWSLLAAGQGHTCGLDFDGAVWCWGRNTEKNLGLGEGTPPQVRTLSRVGTRSDWKDLMSSQQGSCALDRDDALWCWGAVWSDIFGTAVAATPAKVDGSTWRAVSVDVFHLCGVKADGTLWCVGRGIEGQLGLADLSPRTALTRVGTESDWAEVQVGRFHTCARKNNGSLFCTGENGDGRLGIGVVERRATFTPVQ